MPRIVYKRSLFVGDARHIRSSSLQHQLSTILIPSTDDRIPSGCGYQILALNGTHIPPRNVIGTPTVALTPNRMLPTKELWIDRMWSRYWWMESTAGVRYAKISTILIMILTTVFGQRDGFSNDGRPQAFILTGHHRISDRSLMLLLDYLGRM